MSRIIKCNHLRRFFDFLESRLLLAGNFTTPAILVAPLYPTAIVVADFNGDGSDDIATAGKGHLTIYMNTHTSSGTFSAPVDYVALVGLDLAVGHFNGDNKPDIVVADGVGGLEIFLNDGNGAFPTKSTIALTNCLSVVTGYFNGDTKTDIAVVNNDKISILLGNGNGSFAPNVDYAAGLGPMRIAAADFNGDHKLDLAVSGQSGNAGVLLNNGDGVFSAPLFYGDSGYAYGITTGDINGDGAPDIITTSQTNLGRVYFNKNDNSGTFNSTPFQFVTNFAGLSVVATDFDGDGDVDIAILHEGAVSYFRNVGGTIQPDVWYEFETKITQVAFGDFNDDNLPDFAVLGYTSEVYIELNAGGGVFAGPAGYTQHGAPLWNGINKIAVGDFDGDGFIDEAVLQGQSHVISIIFNQGDGTFGPPTNYTLNGWLFDVVATNVDPGLDNDLDLITIDYSGSFAYMMRNDGHGVFTIAGTYSLPYTPFRMTTGDYNGDGFPDFAVVCHTNAQFNNTYLSVWYGSATGSFSSSGPFPFDGGDNVVSGDINHDGCDDIVANTFNGLCIYYGNDFTRTKHKILLYLGNAIQPTSFAIADFNHDSLPDIAFSSGAVYVSVLINHGDYTFSLTNLDSYTNEFDGLVAADFDRDGNVDLAAAGSDYSLHIFLGDGQGGFGPDRSLGFFLPLSFLAAPDLNNDNRPDLVMFHEDQVLTYLNFALIPAPPIVSTIKTTTQQELDLPISKSTFLSGYFSENNRELASIEISSLPTHGTLKSAGVPITVGQEISNFSNLVYTPDFNFFGPDSFSWLAFDGIFFSATAANFNIIVTHVNHAPTDISLSANVVIENKPTATVVGNLSSTDRDPNNTFSYSLVPGAGSTDNSLFTILAGVLKTAIPLNFENKSSYSIRLRTTDQGGLFFEKTFTVTATDIEEAPVLLPMNKIIPQNGVLDLATADFLAAFVDPDTGATPHDLVNIKITTLPKKGVLVLSGVPVTLNQEIAAADLDNLIYAPKIDFLGNDTIGFNATDGTLYAAKVSSLTVHVVGAEIAVAGVVADKPVNINTGDTTPSATDGTDLGSILVGGASIDQPFTITNLGTADLTLGSITLPAGYTLTAAPASTVAPGQSTTFIITLDPASVGTYTGTVSFTNNDTGVAGITESPFTFTLHAEVVPVVVGALNTIKIAANKPKASEVNAATSGKGQFTFTRTGNALAFTQAVEYEVTGTATDGTDFVHLTGTVVFAPKKPTAVVNLQPILDQLAEGSETVTLTVIQDNGATYAINNSASSATATIADGASTITITANKPKAAELAGNKAGAGQFTVKRTGGSMVNPLTVHYTISGTASNDGSDFTQLLTGDITIPAGKPSAVLTINPIDDLVIEGNETLTLTLAADPAYFLPALNKPATVTITDHNRKPTAGVLTALTTALATPLTITYADLLTATGVTDPEGQPLTFKITTITKGALTEFGVTVKPNTVTLFPGDSIIYTPAANAVTGTLTAFSLTASDGVNVTAPIAIKITLT